MWLNNLIKETKCKSGSCFSNIQVISFEFWYKIKTFDPKIMIRVLHRVGFGSWWKKNTWVGSRLLDDKYVKIYQKKSDRYWFKSLGSLILLRNLLNVWALSCETKKSERTLGVCHIISFTIILAHFLISYEKFIAWCSRYFDLLTYCHGNNKHGWERHYYWLHSGPKEEQL